MGDLAVVASADLGGLGAKEGTPVSHSWTMPSLMPVALPWLALLVLLMLPPNRTGQAWWIWLPLAGVIALAAEARALLEAAPGMGLEMAADLAGALAFGPAAVWLLAPHLRNQHRVLVFLALVLIQGALGLVAWGGLGSEGLDPEFFLPTTGCWVGTSSVALSLAGWVCRRQYGPRRFVNWFVIWLALGWTCVVAPFLFSALGAGVSGVYAMFGMVIAMATGLVCLTWLPFLVLAFVHPFFRERFVGLLELPVEGGAATAAPMPTVPV